jgi:hypothetical protein
MRSVTSFSLRPFIGLILPVPSVMSFLSSASFFACTSFEPSAAMFTFIILAMFALPSPLAP